MGTMGSIWGVGGILAVLAYAVFRLALRAWQIPSYDLTWYHWLLLALNTMILLYFKSYRAFLLRLAPRVAARAGEVRLHPTAARVVLAPFYCLGYFGSGRAVRIRMLSITLAMVALVIAVRYLPEPWRAILDFGIAIALGLGFIFILIASLRHQPPQ